MLSDFQIASFSAICAEKPVNPALGNPSAEFSLASMSHGIVNFDRGLITGIIATFLVLS
jgi:hypothetical protein